MRQPKGTQRFVATKFRRIDAKDQNNGHFVVSRQKVVIYQCCAFYARFSVVRGMHTPVRLRQQMAICIYCNGVEQMVVHGMFIRVELLLEEVT